jgi:hypothetical protein
VPCILMGLTSYKKWWETVSGRGCREWCSAYSQDLQSVRGEEAVSGRGCREWCSAHLRGVPAVRGEEEAVSARGAESCAVHTRETYSL